MSHLPAGEDPEVKVGGRAAEVTSWALTLEAGNF